MAYQTCLLEGGQECNRCGKKGDKVDADAEAEEEKDEVDGDDGGSSRGMEGDRSDKPDARGCGGGFFGFRESEKRGKNMGRPEEGKPIVWGDPRIPPVFQLLCRTARTRALLTRLIAPSTYIVWSCTNGANRIE